MRKALFLILAIALSMGVMAQQKIQLRSVDKAECVKSDMTSLEASFSFSTIEAQDYESERGTFSWLSLANTVIGGNEGDPQIPVINQLIAVPFGATPRIEITSYSSTDYRLEDFGIHTLVPRQLPVRKNQHFEDVPFIMNEAAYQSSRNFRSEPMAVVRVEGVMRGVQLGKMTIEPVSYDPVNNTLRVFNDIEVTVHFDGADARATEDMLLKTYSPYFDIVYKQLLNGRAITSIYDQHPDLYTTPVKMLVVTTSTYVNSTAFQNWLTWKKQKGIAVDVQTVANNASASTIKNLIYSRYNVNHPTFLVIVGDETVVTYYSLWDYESSYGNAATDLEYASVDGDIYHDMYISRMPVSSTTELTNLINKTLTYEKYTMSNPSYLDETLLIAGWDSQATSYIGGPTIQYANNYYFNSAHGITPHVFITTGANQRTCYNYINNVGFVNYTAHGDIQMWADPSFTNTNVNSLTNNDKYFWAMGNCCLTSNFKNAQNDETCFGEAMVRAANKGAWGYIGSVPESLWYEDYYFGVGATNTFGQMPTQAQTSTGAYDALFDDASFNTLNAVPFIGNVAVSYAHANGYTSSVDDEYYWRAYQCFGDGSVMPYLKVPAANNVSHASTIGIGMTTFTVNADPGSYVAITKNNEILGVAQVGSNGIAEVPVSGLSSAGDVMIVVTRNQRQPYITTIQAVSLDGPYISVDGYEPNMALVGENTDLSITFKNVGTAATTGTTTVTLTSTNSYVTILSDPKTFSSLAPNATTTVNGFSFLINSGVSLGSNIFLHYTAVNGSNTWEGDLSITPNQVFTVTVAANNSNYGTVSGGGQYNYNQSCTVTASPTDGYMFTNWTMNGEVVSTDATYTFNVTSNVDLVANFTAGVMIGSGTNTSDYLPAYSYYTNSLSEQIYTSAELGGAGLITSIAFFNGGAEKTLNCDFYLKTTTKNSFSSKTDWIAVSDSDKVFSGSVTMIENDWTTITFNTPFVYDGTSNVVLVTDKSTQWSYSPHMSCRVFDAGSNQALYIYDDDINYSPLAPPTSSTSNNKVMSSKNQLIVTKESFDDCVRPLNVQVNNVTHSTATVTWDGYSDDFNVQWGWYDFMISEDFDEAIPANWTNNSTYPWTVVDGHIQSGNGGVNNSTSSITVTVTYPADGTISFDFWSRGEGSDSNDWDNSRFYIDDERMFRYGAHNNWESYSTEVSAGTHTFKWEYKKDGSVNPGGDYFAVDNVVMRSNELYWEEPVFVENEEYTITGLTPTTTYCVRVQGICDDVVTEWSEIVSFTTDEITLVTQTVALSAGWNWWAPTVETSVNDLETALGSNGVLILSQSSGYCRYESGSWNGTLSSLVLGEMYKIQTSDACNFTLSGGSLPSVTITIVPGYTWFGYTGTQPLAVQNLDITPVNGDKINSLNEGYAIYENGAWSGTLNELQPGHGYIYMSYATTNKELIFTSGENKR